jgi:hypothetical protein
VDAVRTVGPVELGGEYYGKASALSNFFRPYRMSDAGGKNIDSRVNSVLKSYFVHAGNKLQANEFFRNSGFSQAIG